VGIVPHTVPFLLVMRLLLLPLLVVVVLMVGVGARRKRLVAIPRIPGAKTTPWKMLPPPQKKRKWPPGESTGKKKREAKWKRWGRIRGMGPDPKIRVSGWKRMGKRSEPKAHDLPKRRGRGRWRPPPFRLRLRLPKPRSRKAPMLLRLLLPRRRAFRFHGLLAASRPWGGRRTRRSLRHRRHRRLLPLLFSPFPLLPLPSWGGGGEGGGKRTMERSRPGPKRRPRRRSTPLWRSPCRHRPQRRRRRAMATQGTGMRSGEKKRRGFSRRWNVFSRPPRWRLLRLRLLLRGRWIRVQGVRLPPLFQRDAKERQG